VRDLDAAGLAAATGLHLRLDDDGAAELLSRGARLLGGVSDDAGEYGNPVALEQVTGLVLVEIHLTAGSFRGDFGRRPRRPGDSRTLP
jgi:hypothetical protein